MAQHPVHQADPSRHNQPHHDHSTHLASAEAKGPGHAGHAGHDHAGMVADYRRRFWIALVLTVPILLLSPAGGHGLGLIGAIMFPGSHLVLLALSSAVYFYGGWPFLTGLFSELRQRQPGMMTLISLAISVAYFYSAAVVLGLSGNVLFWELATLIDIMLLGHWIEMKSVMGASGALKALVELLPATAHRLAADGNQQEVAATDLRPGDRVLVKPGERVPTDAQIIEGTTSLDESMLTGESKPVTRGPGETAIGGSVNGEGAIVVQIAKTGTLTEGRFGVTNVVPLADADDREVLRLAAALESQSEHPIARGIVQRAKELSLPFERVTEFRNVTGQGALARIGEDKIAVVGPGYLAEKGVPSTAIRFCADTNRRSAESAQFQTGTQLCAPAAAPSYCRYLADSR